MCHRIRVRALSALLVVLAAATACADSEVDGSVDVASSARAVVEPSTTATTATTNTTTTTTLAPELDGDGVPRVARTTTDIVMPVIEELDGGILVRTPCQDLAVVRDAATLDRVHVVLDPGHGGEESGSATADGLAEKNVNLDVAMIAEEMLSEQGFVVTLTRYADIRIPLVTRVEIADSLNALLLVSIHHQGTDPDVPRSDTPGTEVYYQQDSDESKRFAGLLHEEAVAKLGQFEIDSWFANPDAGATYRQNPDTGEDFYGMVRRPETPAVLAEMSFLGNPEEVELLRSPDFLRAEAEAISDAVIRWFTTEDPGSGFVEPSFSLRSSGGGGGLNGCVDPDLGETAEVPTSLLEEFSDG
jgi:N-acetylmuramoyl-L-alanine amidase